MKRIKKEEKKVKLTIRFCPQTMDLRIEMSMQWQAKKRLNLFALFQFNKIK